MEKLVVNVKDKDGKIVKTCEAKPIEIEFGTIRSIMELLNIEKIDDTWELMKTVYNVWDKLTGILSEAFPDMERDDWEHVKLNELIPVVYGILQYSFSEILTIPNDPKNAIAG